MSATPAGLLDTVLATLDRRRLDDGRCPRCGSFLDAPRINP